MDLSSFAMLLLESSDHGGTIALAQMSEIPLDHVPDIVDCRTATTSSGAKGIKNFFRKRHKSTSSGGSPTTASNGIHLYHNDDTSPTSSAPGSKVRTLFSGAVRTRSKSDITSYANCTHGVSNSCGSRPCTFTVQSETVELMFTSTAESSTSSSSDGCRSRGSSGDSGIPASSTGSASRLSQSLNVYGTRSPMMPIMPAAGSSSGQPLSSSYKRSCSVREDAPPIGPTEFVEMFRSRAYSDPRLLDRNRLLERHRQMAMSPPAMSGSWSSAGAFEPRQMIIWKDPQKGTSVFRLPSTDEEDCLGVPFDKTDEHVFVRFLKTHSCYDVMPTSNKMVVLDTHLNVKKAFYAMVNNGVRVAPLWDTDAQTVTGMFTITDFIKILLKYHRASQFDMEDIEDHTIASWNELLSDCTVRPLVSVGPDTTMMDAIRTLCLNRVHRLPVIDPESGNILYLLTHRRLLHYLYYFFQRYDLPRPPFMEKSISELSIGTYGRIATVRLDTSLAVALELFLTYRVSSVPVVDNNGKLIAIYAKANVVNLAADKTYANLTETLEQVIGSEPRNCANLTCTKQESLKVVINRIVQNELHRVFVLDDDGKVEGVVSLSDILRRLVVTPPEDVKDLQWRCQRLGMNLPSG